MALIFRKLSFLFMISLLLSCLAGCGSLFGRHGFFRDRGDDYMKATEMPPMKVPEKYDSSTISELFVIPPISNEYLNVEKEFEAPRPKLITNADHVEVKIQKLDTRRWIVINNSPGVVWPRIKRFFEDKNITLSNVDAVTGIMDTDWLKLPNETDSKDRYRIKMEQGLQPGSTEIHVTQITVAASVAGAGAVNWPANSVNPDREKWLVDTLSTYLAQDDKVAVSLLAQGISGSHKVELVQPSQGEGFLVFSLDTDRVWASVGGALEHSPFEILDMNRSDEVFQIAFDPDPPKGDEKPPGFFSKLFGFDARARARHEKAKIHYRVQVIPAGKEVRVYIKSDQNAPLQAQDTEKLLNIIRKQLL